MTDFTGYKTFARIFIWFVFIYVVLFQFIVPYNPIFPAPSIMLETLPDLFSKYRFASALGFTLTAVLFIPIGGFACFYFTRVPVIKFFLKYDLTRWLPALFKFFPVIFFVFILAIWTGDSFIGEVVALLLVAGFNQKIAMSKKVREVPKHFYLFAKSAGMSDNEIYGKVYGKLLLPYAFEKIGELFFAGWMYAFVYEIVSGNYGVGAIFYTAIKYGDLSAFFLVLLIMIIVIYLTGLVYKTIQYKVVRWIPDEF
jgi:ABC-type nitrate/sulfonate/bicarbonate transport system permease component